ncbi:MAG: histidine kinase [Bacteroidota bacterium]
MLVQRLEVVFHIIFWGIVLLFLFLALGQRLRILEEDRVLNYYISYEPFTLLLLFIDVICKALFFYYNALYLSPRLLLKRDYKHYILLTSASFLITLILSWCISYFLIYLFDQKYGSVFYDLPFVLLIHFLLIPFSLAYVSIKDRIRQEKNQERLIREKLVAELRFLKQQINPHFLFNTLNNIYAITNKYQDKKATNSIAKLARMMRYMLHESDTQYVPLHKELQYIQDFIALEKMRLPKSEHIKVFYDQEVYDQNIEVSPMLFIPLIENAFKHGISFSKASLIEVAICQKRTAEIFLTVKNTNHAKSNPVNDQNRGIGLQNLRKRLELLYPDHSDLSLEEDNIYFKATLTLKV